MILNFNSNIHQHKEAIQSIISNTEYDFLELTNLPTLFFEKIDIYISGSPQHQRYSNPEVTCRAESFYSGVIFIDINSNTAFDKYELTQVVFHELTHVARGLMKEEASIKSLLQSSIEEGLALFIEQQAQQRFHYRFPGHSQIPKVKINTLLKGLKQIVEIDTHNLDWDCDEWFYNFDSYNPDFPKNFAYSIGKFIVQDFHKQTKIETDRLLQLPLSHFIRYALLLSGEGK